MHFRILKMIATSGFLTALECTEFVFGQGSATDPAGEAYCADGLTGVRGKGEWKEDVEGGGKELCWPPPFVFSAYATASIVTFPAVQHHCLLTSTKLYCVVTVAHYMIVRWYWRPLATPWSVHHEFCTRTCGNSHFYLSASCVSLVLCWRQCVLDV